MENMILATLDTQKILYLKNVGHIWNQHKVNVLVFVITRAHLNAFQKNIC